MAARGDAGLLSLLKSTLGYSDYSGLLRVTHGYSWETHGVLMVTQGYLGNSRLLTVTPGYSERLMATHGNSWPLRLLWATLGYSRYSG